MDLKFSLSSDISDAIDIRIGTFSDSDFNAVGRTRSIFFKKMEVDTQSDKFGLRTDSGKSQVLLYVKIKYSPALDLSSPQSSAEFPMRMPAFLPSIAARYPHELAVAEDEKAQQPFVSQPVKNAGCDVLIQME